MKEPINTTHTMDRKLREGAERIRWIEGFDVAIHRRSSCSSLCNHVSYVRYDQSRAASHKWTVAQWKERRFDWLALEVKVLMPDGEPVGDGTPIDIPRRAYRLEKWHQKPPFGSLIGFSFVAPDSHVAMQLRTDLLKVGVDSEYKLEKWLFFKSHILTWNSPPVHMMTFEWRKFILDVETITGKLGSTCEWRVMNSAPQFLDEQGYGYTYFDGSHPDRECRTASKVGGDPDNLRLRVSPTMFDSVRCGAIDFIYLGKTPDTAKRFEGRIIRNITIRCGAKPNFLSMKIECRSIVMATQKSLFYRIYLGRILEVSEPG